MAGNLRYAVFGCGFWSRFQIAAWREVGGVDLVAVYNRTRSKAEELAARFGGPAVYDDAEALLRRERLDFVDIITDVATHAPLTAVVAGHGVPVICQKPMAPTVAAAEGMVSCCRRAGVGLHIHENWRYQHPIRQVKAVLNNGALGRPFRARITFASHFPVFDNQPFLKDVEQFIIADIGSHILDTARFLFGEASDLLCRTRRVTPGIRGEDVATVFMTMGDGIAVTCEMSYATYAAYDRFPETAVCVECEHGTVELGPDYWIRVTTAAGTHSRRHVPPLYPWVDPRYQVVQAAIVPTNAAILAALRSGRPAETSGDDNLKTVRLVFGAYESAAAGRLVVLT